MFMILLKKNAPILVFLLVLVLSGLWIWASYDSPKEDAAVKQALADKKKVIESLSAGLVTDGCIYSHESAGELRYVDTLKRNVERNKVAVDGSIGTFVSYPQPVRPKSGAARDHPAYKIFPRTPSLKSGSGDTSVWATRGRVYIKFEMPAADEFVVIHPGGGRIVLMEPVRIEIFRGTSKDSIDLTTPIGTIELGPEDGPAVTSVGRIALPLTTRVFRDQKNIAPQTEYFYQGRLVMRYTTTKLSEQMRNPDGTDGVLNLYQLPDAKDATPVAPANPASTARLFATALTPVEGTMTPGNFDLRLMQTIGTVPLPDRRKPSAHDDASFSVTLAMKVWIPEIGEWRRKTLADLHEGDRIGGKITYQSAGKKVDFDLAKEFPYKLYEVNMEEVESPPGALKVYREVALLQNLKNPKDILRVEKRAEWQDKEDQRSAEYDKLIDAQNREMERIKKAAATVVAPK